jgi:PAS domain S-box-containing protein
MANPSNALKDNRQYTSNSSSVAGGSVHEPDLGAQYQALFTAMAEGALMHGEQGQILSINPAAERILGCNAAEVIANGSTFPWPVQRENGDQFLKEKLPWMVVLRTGQPQSDLVMGVRCAQGGQAWIRVNSQPIFAPGRGECRAVMTLFQEITRQPLADEMPWQDESHLHALFEVIPNPFFVKGQDGRYLACNNAFERFLGMSRDRILGRTVYDISSKELADRYAEADRALFENPGGQVYEAKVQWADGSLRDVIFHKTALTRADGSVHGITGLIVDITDRKQIEQTLRLKEQRYRTLVEHSPDLVVRYDNQLRRIYVNPAWERASGLSAGEVINLPPAEIPKVPQPIASDYEVALRHVLEKGERRAVEFSWVNARGEELCLQYVVVPEIDEEGSVVSLLAVGRDITEYKRSEDALLASESHLRQVNRALRTLSAGNEALVRAGSEQELLEKMCRIMVEVGGHVLATIGDVRADTKGIDVRAWHGKDDPHLRQCICSVNCHPLVLALERRVPTVVHDITNDPRCSACPIRHDSGGVRSSLILPLQYEGESLGVLSIHSADQAVFNDDEVVLMNELGNDLSYGIRALRDRMERMEGLRRIQATMEETIQALASTVEFRDPYTAGHQRRVAQLAIEIGREMGLADDRITGLYLASVIHDIGKIRIPAEVLTRPGRLSRVEYEIVMAHVDAGYEILKPIDFPWPIAEIVRQHHERLDGSGYPLGIGGETLLLESRILAVADVVEAISSFRPYRPGLGVEHALGEIEAGRDKLFDGEVVDACTRLFRALDFSFD